LSEQIIMLIVYLIGVVLSGLYSAYRFGTLTSHEQAIVFTVHVWSVFLWPLFILFLPFMGMYSLGTKERTKRLEKEYKQQGLL
jgi:hypothetical protein